MSIAKMLIAKGYKLTADLLDDLSGGGAAVGVGGNNDVHTIDGLSALLTSQVVVSYTSNSLVGIDLLNSGPVVDNQVDVGIDVFKGERTA